MKDYYYGFCLCTVNDFQQQQSSQIKSIEKKYESIVAEKAAKHQKQIDVREIIYVITTIKVFTFRNYWQDLRTAQKYRKI